MADEIPSTTESKAPTLYDIIGVEPTATDEEIKKAYRKKAMILHPDRNKDDPQANEKFQQLSEAYEILKDPEKRKRYDMFGSGEETPETPEDVELFEMMTQILGLGRSRAAPKGNKVSPTIRLLRVPLKTLYNGGQMNIKVDYHKICPRCEGIGSISRTEYPICPVCNGAGSLSPGGLQFLFPCRNCDSTGYLIPPEDRCPECKGRKLIRTKKVVPVNIEMGTSSEDHIVFENQGDEYPGKQPADLMFIVSEKKDSDFIRDGDDLYYIKNLSILEQKQGTAFTIKTLDGRELEVYTEKGVPVDMTRLKWIQNEGMPCKGNLQFRGNLYIIFDKGFPDPFHEGFRTIATLFNRKFGSKMLLQDAPEEKQEQYREYIRQQEELYNEMIRELQAERDAARAEKERLKAERQAEREARKAEYDAQATAFLSGN